MIPGIGIREMPADISPAQGPENGITEGMSQDIGIRVAGQSVDVRDGDAAQDQFPVRDQAVGIIAVADAGLLLRSGLHNFFGDDQVLRPGDLDIGL